MMKKYKIIYVMETPKQFWFGQFLVGNESQAGGIIV